MNKLVRLTSFLVLCYSAFGQTSPRLNLTNLSPERTSEIRELKAPAMRSDVLRSHLLIQYQEAPSADQLKWLRDRGVNLLSYIPDYGFAISARDGTAFEEAGLRWYGRLEAEEKLSPELHGKLASGGEGHYVVEFYSDVDRNDERAIVSQSGLFIQDHSDLLPIHLLVYGPWDRLMRMAEWDEVAYIFPASDELVRGAPVHACAGALTSQGTVSQAVPTIGDGWDGPGLGSANLLYAFASVTAKLPAGSVQPEIVRAFGEWAKYASVTFTASNVTNGPQTISVLFASRAHGDGYPFDGPGGVVAHTFYPYPVNPEPIAGDMHFDNDESWKIGADTDVYSVALHETGHALGLGHTTNPNAVMYPYYSRHTVLSTDDIAAVLTLYAPQAGAPAAGSPPPAPTPPPPPAPTTPAPAPVTIQIGSPTSGLFYNTTASTVTLSGIVTGNSAIDRVTWMNSQGGGGVASGTTAWSTGPIALKPGSNIIIITAVVHTGGQVTAGLQVSYSASPSGGSDTTPPSLTITAPFTATVNTSASSIVFKGAAADNVGVVSVTWSNSSGASGVANGTASWTTPPIPLLVGSNTITIRASDAAGNTSWRSVVVTRS